MVSVQEYPLAVIRDSFVPAGDWKRGAYPVVHGDRNWCYLPDVRTWWGRAGYWILMGDDRKAQACAERAGHFALLYLRGVL